uniref:Uncharacterized protein n=1 Tax=Raoultella ornithinolytica TaxID=54291 RepID=A0A7G9A6I9_RAOOR|nr:Hypothetical protein [Raoultella ornithinolytica]
MSPWNVIFIINNIIILLINFLAYESNKVRRPVFYSFSAHENL